MFLNRNFLLGNTRLLCSLTLLAAVILALNLSAANAAGFRKMKVGGENVGIWYPSDTEATPQRLGPFDTEMALDAPIQAGRHQIVMLSHGIGGRYRNHYLTAQALADAGFVVIAPQHKADYLIDGRKRVQALDHRYVELARALKAVQEDPVFRDHISPAPVHGVGYSLGGATIMLASGAGFSSDLFEAHCDANDREDGEFCDGPGFFYHLIQWFMRDAPDMRAASDPFYNPPFITGKAIVIAPIFQGIDIDAEQSLSMEALTVIAIEGDKIAKPKFHAKPLFEAAKGQVDAHFYAVPGHHFAFIAPFPKRITEKEHIPVAIDPDGFDRPAFLKVVNARILDALAE